MLVATYPYESKPIWAGTMNLPECSKQIISKCIVCSPKQSSSLKISPMFFYKNERKKNIILGLFIFFGGGGGASANILK